MVAAMLPKTETHRILRPTKKKKKKLYTYVYRKTKKKSTVCPDCARFEKMQSGLSARYLLTYFIIFFYVLFCTFTDFQCTNNTKMKYLVYQWIVLFGALFTVPVDPTDDYLTNPEIRKFLVCLGCNCRTA